MCKEEKINLPDGQPAADGGDRPLVTFAVFAYNQEKYVREAVEGAFSQTYEPLEIILSDDCSTDRTFEIMQEMAAVYRGPHRVRLNRCQVNLGPMGHLLAVAGISSGALIVDAAGDDVSMPLRTQIVVDIWSETRSWAVTTSYDVIDKDGVLIEKDRASRGAKNQIWKLFKAPPRTKFIHGATAAYDTRLFVELPRPKQMIMNEDAIMTFLLVLLSKKVAVVSKSTVKYRRHVDALTNRERPNTFKAITQLEESTIARYIYYINCLEYYKDIIDAALQRHSPEVLCLPDVAAMERARWLFQSIARWDESGFFQRLSFIFAVQDREYRRWAFWRLFGLRALSRAKSYRWCF